MFYSTHVTIKILNTCELENKITTDKSPPKLNYTAPNLSLVLLTSVINGGNLSQVESNGGIFS